MSIQALHSRNPFNRSAQRSQLLQGTLTKRSARGAEIFGWPCREIIRLEDGEDAYLLDFEGGTAAPTELRCYTRPQTGSVDRSKIPVLVRVVSVFNRWIVVDFEPRAPEWPETPMTSGEFAALLRVA